MSFDKISDLTAGVYFNFYNSFSGHPSDLVTLRLCQPNRCKTLGGRGRAVGTGGDWDAPYTLLVLSYRYNVRIS